MACGNNHISRDYLSSAPASPSLTVPPTPTTNMARAARLAAITRAQARGERVAKGQNVVGLSKESPERAQQLLEYLQSATIMTNSRLDSPERDRDVVTVTVDESKRPGVLADIYHDGLGAPDGPGHAHSELRTDGTVVTFRSAYDPRALGARQAANLHKTL